MMMSPQGDCSPCLWIPGTQSVQFASYSKGLLLPHLVQRESHFRNQVPQPYGIRTAGVDLGPRGVIASLFPRSTYSSCWRHRTIVKPFCSLSLCSLENGIPSLQSEADQQA